MTHASWRLVLAILGVLWAPLVFADAPNSYSNPAISARLISVETGVPRNTETLSVGLDIQLAEGWKAYWRSPGEVGLPPEINWEGSQNMASAKILWPAPERFTAFGIENFGYHDRVVFPIQVVLETAGQPVELEAQVSLLTCSDICVPHDFDLSLEVPVGTGIDTTAASIITEFAQRVPLAPADSDIIVETAAIADDALYLTASSPNAFANPDIFPEMGPRFTFGKPDIRVNAAGTEIWAKLPLLAREEPLPPLQVTVTDGQRAVTATPEWSQNIPDAPFELAVTLPDLTQMSAIVAFAFIGGLLLNVMPCVLPVLSIKLSSVLNHDGKPTQEVRKSFLISALGVLSFMWALSTGILVLRSVGITVGWGLQFQSPIFLTIMFLVLVIFAANLFGIFEISLPSGFQSRLASTSSREGHVGDFATGAFAAVLATPCSAPFLGTAIAFALSGRPVDVVMVFTALGLGLAVPYLLFAWKPELINLVPRPGRWMIVLKWLLGTLLGGTALWLLWVLAGVAGHWIAGSALGFALAFVLVAAIPLGGGYTRLVSLSSVAIMGIAYTSSLASQPVAKVLEQNWVEFDQRKIPRLISQGKTVFVDVTADWCLTCKANKALVLDRSPVAERLRDDEVIAMRADWTRPNPEISRYLESHDRYGIPFNIVYGPRAPGGILLSEVLSSTSVTNALKEAGPRN